MPEENVEQRHARRSLPADHVVGQLQAADVLQGAAVDALLAGAVLATGVTVVAARSALVSRFDMPAERARAAVADSRSLMRGSHVADPLGMLSGTSQPEAQYTLLRGLLHASGASAASAPSKVSFSAVRAAWHADRLARTAASAATSHDLPSMLVAAALVASMRHLAERDFAGVLATALTLPLIPDDRTHRRLATASRVLLAAYSMDARRQAGLDLGGGYSWADAPAGWRAEVGPWLLPIIEPGQPAAVQQLLWAMRQRRLTVLRPCAALDDRRSHHDGVVATARDMATAAEPDLTVWFNRPMWFDGGSGDRQVLLTQDDDYVYAWVGRSNRGVLVSFDTATYTGYGLDDPLTVPALAEAIAWFLDVSISLRRSPTGTSTVKRASSGAASGGFRYMPRASYARQRNDVGTGASTPPRSHLVAPFVRHLPDGQRPNAAQVAHAPAGLRRRMGPQDTFVRSHQRGPGLATIDWTARLSKLSALADIHGLLDRGG